MMKIISGFLLLISSITVFIMLISEPETMAVFFRFNIDITVEDLGDVIAGFAAGIAAVIGALITSIIFGVIYFLVYFIIGLVTIFTKKGKGLIITVIILTCLSLFIEIRALVIISIGTYTSMILPARLAIDAIILGISIYGLVVLSKNSKKIVSVAS